MHDLDLTVNMLGLCDPSNLLFVLSARSDALFSNYFEDLFALFAIFFMADLIASVVSFVACMLPCGPPVLVKALYFSIVSLWSWLAVHSKICLVTSLSPHMVCFIFLAIVAVHSQHISSYFKHCPCIFPCKAFPIILQACTICNFV